MARRLVRNTRRGVLAMAGVLTSELAGYVFSPIWEGDFHSTGALAIAWRAVLVVTAEALSKTAALDSGSR
jgi:hypothetical protein